MIVTGVARGVGRGVAQLFAAAKAEAVVADAGWSRSAARAVVCSSVAAQVASRARASADGVAGSELSIDSPARVAAGGC